MFNIKVEVDLPPNLSEKAIKRIEQLIPHNDTNRSCQTFYKLVISKIIFIFINTLEQYSSIGAADM